MERCDACRYWLPFRSGDEQGSGECRRHPPTVVLVELEAFGPTSQDKTGFNAMNGSEWPQTGPGPGCGEHQPIEAPVRRVDDHR